VATSDTGKFRPRHSSWYGRISMRRCWQCSWSLCFRGVAHLMWSMKMSYVVFYPWRILEFAATGLDRIDRGWTKGHSKVPLKMTLSFAHGNPALLYAFLATSHRTRYSTAAPIESIYLTSSISVGGTQDCAEPTSFWLGLPWSRHGENTKRPDQGLYYLHVMFLSE
jgi:hypothetical protein